MCKINGKKLGELRAKAGVSQKELAKELGMSIASIQNYEYGKTEPSTDTTDRICMILKINRGEIEVHDIGYNYKTGESKVVLSERKRLGKNRKSSPIETEKFINDRRNYSEVEEKVEIKKALKVSPTVANKKYIIIDPTCLHIPHWQRDTDMAKVAEIATNFNDKKFDPIKIYIKGDYIADVADGAHRVVALVKRNEGKPKDEREFIIAEVLDCTEYEAMNIFFDQGAGRTSLSVSDSYRAGINIGKSEYLKLKNICERNKIQITAEENIIDNPIGKLTPSRTALRLADTPNDIMEKAIRLIRNLEWSGSKKNAFLLRNLEVIKKLYANFGDEVEEKLLKKCKGAAFYESKVVPVKSNAELFDILSAEISK